MITKSMLWFAGNFGLSQIVYVSCLWLCFDKFTSRSREAKYVFMISPRRGGGFFWMKQRYCQRPAPPPEVVRPAIASKHCDCCQKSGRTGETTASACVYGKTALARLFQSNPGLPESLLINGERVRANTARKPPAAHERRWSGCTPSADSATPRWHSCWSGAPTSDATCWVADFKKRRCWWCWN